MYRQLFHFGLSRHHLQQLLPSWACVQPLLHHWPAPPWPRPLLVYHSCRSLVETGSGSISVVVYPRYESIVGDYIVTMWGWRMRVNKSVIREIVLISENFQNHRSRPYLFLLTQNDITILGFDTLVDCRRTFNVHFLHILILPVK